MKNPLARAALIVCIAALFVAVVGFVFGATCWQSLRGNVGVAPPSGSGWLDLSKVTNFQKGDKLRLKLGGSAKKIVVRLLSKGDDPTQPVGIDGDIVEVPNSRVVETELQQDHTDVVQISVHGGPNPWKLYQMGGGNGPAALLSAERCPKGTKP